MKKRASKMTDQVDLDAAIEMCGSKIELARALKVAPTTVYSWCNRDHVPHWHHDKFRRLARGRRTGHRPLIKPRGERKPHRKKKRH